MAKKNKRSPIEIIDTEETIAFRKTVESNGFLRFLRRKSMERYGYINTGDKFMTEVVLMFRRKEKLKKLNDNN